ncbi:uncharacterized protein MONBRDRAFT_37345 [Monosiga brevicollis MX1]|uniref:TLC domain-containing protein n=1 Tax=Monosiga brevicollis TaxID=81824 RepID=A9V150_MONBE|nr:uncharacterized protein MONBRDRAFT_37345 [Monosiga brevicollis MX1]EDQ88871.1 predicted protein [Monosiga brevicollis MX1]|eukprot:XP_001746484.1 hypothetical protein [Monosiga brevicollis MX1]
MDQATRVLIDALVPSNGASWWPWIYPDLSGLDGAACLVDVGDGPCLDPARIIVWSVVFHTLVLLASRGFFLIVSKGYRRESFLDQVYWDSCIVGAVHAWMSAVFSIWFLSTTDIFNESIAQASSVANFQFGITGGYFIYDLVLCAVMAPFTPKFADPNIFLHHILGSTGFLQLITCRASWMGLALLTWELSTPFVNFRVVAAGHFGRDSTVYLLNGLIMIFLFFVVRMVGGVYYWYMSLSHLSDIFARNPIHIVIQLYFNSVAGTSLNLFWFSRMVQGAIKLLRSDKKDPAPLDKKNKKQA